MKKQVESKVPGSKIIDVNERMVMKFKCRFQGKMST